MKKILSLIIALSLCTTVCFADVTTTRAQLDRVSNDIRIIFERIVSGEQVNQDETLKQIKYDTTILESTLNIALRDYKASSKTSDRRVQLGYIMVASSLLSALTSIQKYFEDNQIDNLTTGMSEYNFAKTTLSQIK